MLRCGYEPKPGQCGYHRHGPDGQPVTECTKPVWKRTTRCKRHQSSK